MRHTVKQLADLAGVSVRTLHHYDAIGLLRPAVVGANGYRHYDRGDLLRLQSILFYRELGLGLAEIRRLMAGTKFDAAAALRRHRGEIARRLARLQELLRTIDATTAQLDRPDRMESKQLFTPFSPKKQAQYEEEISRRHGDRGLKESRRKWASHTGAEKKRIADEGNAVYADLVAAMPAGAASPAVQACIMRWRRHLDYFWTPSDEQLLGLARLYNEHPDFLKNFRAIHPNLPEFMLEAVEHHVRSRPAPDAGKLSQNDP